MEDTATDEDRQLCSNLVMLLPAKPEPGKRLFPEETLSTEVCGPDLSAGQVLQVGPVQLGPAVVVAVYQFVRERLVHVALRVDVVFTEDNLLA